MSDLVPLDLPFETAGGSFNIFLEPWNIFEIIGGTYTINKIISINPPNI